MPPRAGLARRFAALVYELLLVTAIVLVLGFVMLPLVSPEAARGTGGLGLPALPARVGLFAVVFGVLAGYYAWSWSNGRATLPQKTWRLRLMRVDGGTVTPRAALARYLAAWTGPLCALAVALVLVPRGLGAHALWLVALPWLWSFVDRERQFLHDRIAGTRVVQLGAR